MSKLSLRISYSLLASVGINMINITTRGRTRDDNMLGVVVRSAKLV